MNIAICEDEPIELRQLRSILSPILPPAGFRGAAIHEFLSGKKLLSDIQHNHILYNLIFLDIYMPDGNGIEIAQIIRKISPDTELVFVTASLDHAVEAFSLQALHYLVKPIAADQIVETLERYSGKRLNRKSIHIKVGRDIVKIYLDCILYLQSENKGTVIYTRNKPFWTGVPLCDLENNLDQGTFLKIQRGFLVNMGFVDRLTSDTCFLKNGESLLLSRKRRKQIRIQYKEYIFNQ